MERSFTGGVFSETIDDGRAGAAIELTASGVCARLDDGTQFVIPYRACQVEVGGFSGKMVFCRNDDRSTTIFCEQKGFPGALSEASSGILDDQLSVGLKSQQNASRRGFLLGTSIVVGVLGLLVAAYFGISVGAKAAVKALPTSVDRQLGSAAFKSMDLGGPIVTDQVVVGAMKSIVQQLAPHAAIDDMDFNVHVVDAPVVNAFALPGGTIVVFTGLIDKADRAEQVAGVLGHEMAHATLRHGLQRISQSMGIWVAISLLLGNTEGLIGMGVDLFQIASINSYSRDQENEADLEGVRMLHAAGIDPNGLAQFFKTLENEEGNLPGIASWISTHPQHTLRIENVRTQVAALPKREYEPLKIDWADIKRRVGSNDKSKPNGDG